MGKLTVKNRFATIPNEILNSKELSFKAKGIYGYIQSKPDDWNFSVKRISTQTGEGVTSVTSGIEELENLGYLRRQKYQDSNGYWGIEYLLYSEKNSENPESENPTQDFPIQDNPMKENIPNNSNTVNNSFDSLTV